MHEVHRTQAQIDGLRAVANLVEVDEGTFRMLLRSHEQPTLVTGQTGFWKLKRHTCMTTYDGFVFCLRSPLPLDFRSEAPAAFVVQAKTVNIPFL
jgi:hypothetical protein